MAVSSSFKQQCPTCEALIPIRDPKLVGKKIDCPKCKYRFVVQAPEPEEEEEAAKPVSKGKSTNVTSKKPVPAKGKGKPAPRKRDDDDEDEDERPARKKKEGSSLVLILGISLAVVALVALAVAGYFFLGPNDSPPSPTNNTSVANAPQGGPKPGGAPGDTTRPGDDASKPESKQGPPLGDITNLLPNDTQAVISISLGQLLKSPLRKALVEAPGTFNAEAFKASLGISIDEVERVIVAVNLTNKWLFSVMRTTKPVDVDYLKRRLRLREQNAANGMTYFLVKGHLDSLGAALVKGAIPHESYALHVLDDGQTLVFADLDPMKQLMEAQGKPKHISEPPSSGADKPKGTTPPGAPGMPGMPPGAPGAPGMPPGAPGASSTPGNPPSGGMSGGPGAFKPPSGMNPNMPGRPGSNEPPEEIVYPPVSSSWLTVSKDLKATLDQIDFAPKKKSALLAFAMDLTAFPAWTTGLKLVPLTGPLAQLGHEANSKELKELTSVGLSVKALDETRVLVGAAEGKDHAITDKEEEAEAGRVQEALDFMKLLNPEDKADLIRVGGRKQRNGMPGNPPGFPGMGPPMPPAGFNPPGANPGFNPQGGPPNPQRGFNPPGAFNPPGGMNPPGGPGFGPMGPGGMPGQQQEEKKGKDGHYAVWSQDRVLAIDFQRNLHGEMLPQIINLLAKGVIALKGLADQADTHWHIFDLAQATQDYLKEKGHFPPGALHRSPSADRVLDWRPDQRLSGLVELLPYLGPEYKDLVTDPNKSWDEEPNKDTGFIVVPQLLSLRPASKELDMFVKVPGHDTPYAATHYVGMAGVGLDAAEYVENDFSTVKKRGIFGYDRTTKLDDIRDGPENTILLIQVPSASQGPWIAGGGSTVRGVAEDADCVRPFVSTTYKDKPGTFAIMADGKVRFIPESIPPDTFRALCTIGGGERIKNIDDIAPEVKPEEEEGPPTLKAEEPAPAGAPRVPPPAPQAKPSSPASPPSPVVEEGKEDPDARKALEKLGAVFLQNSAEPGHTVLEIQLIGKGLTDRDLVHLKGVPQVKILWLNHNKLTDEGFAHLEGLTGLEKLFLNNNPGITDNIVGHLKGMKHLKFINLSNTKVTEKGAQELKSLIPGLTVVH